MPNPLSLIVPFYRQPLMLQRQLAEWNQYPPEVQVILVDDASPEPALPIVQAQASAELREHLRVYRIGVDVPWNREEARNLGAKEANTEWIIQVDIDHIVPAACVPALLAFQPDRYRWYRFPRWRVGRADETRQKDKLSRECTFGQIHPHMDSYMVRRETYWEAGGYDEPTFAGVLGGGSEFLQRLNKVAPWEVLPESICLHVVTRDVVQDSSDQHCNRDTAPGKARWREKQARGESKPTRWLLQPWERVL